MYPRIILRRLLADANIVATQASATTEVQPLSYVSPLLILPGKILLQRMLQGIIAYTSLTGGDITEGLAVSSPSRLHLELVPDIHCDQIFMIRRRWVSCPFFP